MKIFMGVLIFLIAASPMVYAAGDGDLTYGPDQSGLGFNTPRQPNTEYPTMVFVRDRIDLPSSGNEQEGQILWEVSPDNSTWTIAPSWNQNEANIGGLFTAVENEQGTGHTFIVPKGNYYRGRTVTISGSPSFELLEIREIEMDVFDVDPISQLECTPIPRSSETVRCAFTSQILSGRYNNSLEFDYLVLDEDLATIDSGTAFNTGSLGKYRFNFTSPSEEQTMEVTVFNSSEMYADTTMVHVVGILNNNTFFNSTFNNTDINASTFNDNTFNNATLFNSTTSEIDVDEIIQGTTERICMFARPICQERFRSHYEGFVSNNFWGDFL